MHASPSLLITRKRLRAHGTILALCLWSVYLWNMAAPGVRDRAGNLKGADFLHFYTLGSLALAHDGSDLYNMSAQAQLTAQRVPAAAGIRYLPLYPPQVSMLFAPFARLPYLPALALWLVSSAVIYGACVLAIWRVCPQLRDCERIVLVVVLALANPAFWHLIAWGQTSALALACFTLGYLALRAQREFLAGLAFGSLIFKPQLGLAIAIVFLLTLRWKVIAGALAAAFSQLFAAWLYYGAGPLREWVKAMLAIPGTLPLLEPKPYQTHCLRTFWTMIVPWPQAAFALYVVFAIVVSVLMVACWRSRLPLGVRYSAILIASVLLAPHLTVYDLVILAPAFLLLSDWIVSQPPEATASISVLLYFVFALPLLGPLARWTHVQLSVLAMAAILWVIWKLQRNTVLGEPRVVLTGR